MSALSELTQFAVFFHQDFALGFPDMPSGARVYLRGLSPDRKVVLGREFDTFLTDHRSAKALRNSWIRLGAGYAPRGDALLKQMQQVAALLQPA